MQTTTWQDNFNNNGYAVMRNLLSENEINFILKEAEENSKGPLYRPAFQALGDAEIMQDLRDSAMTVYRFGTPGLVDTIGHGFHHLNPEISPTAAFALSYSTCKKISTTFLLFEKKTTTNISLINR
jgi:hypothetical protein